jgi:hypothetical protein
MDNIFLFLPNLGALWDHYYGFSLQYITRQWRHHKKILDRHHMGAERTKSWYYLITLTELLKMRSAWDYKRREPNETK